MKTILLFMGLGMQELLVIGLVILVLFGARKIPDFMKGLGRGVREFQDGIKSERKDPPVTSGKSEQEKVDKVEEERDRD